MRFLLWVAFLICPAMAFGYGYKPTEDSETDHFLSTGAGISSPSVTSALGENPAGLVYNQETKFLGAVGWTNPNFNPIGLGGLFLLGNGTVGGGIGVQTFNAQGDNAGTATLLNFGIAAEIPSIKLAFGASGSYPLLSSGSTPGIGTMSSWRGDIGFIYDPHGEVRLGVTAFDVIGGIDAFGLGIAADANSWATFAIDASMTPNGTGKIVKPSMGIHMMDFQFSLGYGIDLDNTGNNWIRSGGAFGIGIRLSYNVHFQGYYNQLALYYGGLMIRL